MCERRDHKGTNLKCWKNVPKKKVKTTKRDRKKERERDKKKEEGKRRGRGIGRGKERGIGRERGKEGGLVLKNFIIIIILAH